MKNCSSPLLIPCCSVHVQGATWHTEWNKVVLFSHNFKKMVADAAEAAAAAAGSVSAAAHTHAQYNFNYLST